MIRQQRSPARSVRDRAGLSNNALFAVVTLGSTVLFASSVAWGQAHNPPKAQPDTYEYQWTGNPFTGDEDKIAEGQRLYKNTCYICHLDNGGRGPNLKKSKLVDTAFLRIVREGRKDTQMPAWREKLTEEEMWKIYAYIRSIADDTK